MCFELQLMVTGINITVLIDLYLAYFGKGILDGLLEKNGEELVTAMSHAI